jgi:hypothetical protein
MASATTLEPFTAAAIDPPAGRAPLHFGMRPMTGIVASDDAPTRYLEGIELDALDLGRSGPNLAGSTLGAVAKDRLGKALAFRPAFRRRGD